MVNAWTTRTARHSLTPDGQALVEVLRTGRRRVTVLAPLTSLSLTPIRPMDIDALVFTLYQVHDTFDIGTLKAIDGVGSDARCSVKFVKEEEPVIILAKFLVVVV